MTKVQHPELFHHHRDREHVLNDTENRIALLNQITQKYSSVLTILGER